MQFIHFIGIGGIGVSALAQVAQARGARVSGSDTNLDMASNPALARLRDHGAVLYAGHRRENLARDVSLVIATAAVAGDNPEILEADQRGVRVVSRAAYLGELMAAHQGPRIAVAGTHGKTTTTGMIGVMLQHARLEPTVFVGGEVPQLGGNVRIGSLDGPFIAEACEAYDSFLHLCPDIAVITNVEADHLDHYGTEAGVFTAFERFLDNVSDSGSIVACADDSGNIRLLRSVQMRSRNLLTYSAHKDAAQLTARCIELGERPSFVLAGSGIEGEVCVRLRVPGRHNIENALAAAAVGQLLGVSPGIIASGLEEFHGAGRRQETLGSVPAGEGTALILDDYAHHPTEIQATLEALRSAYPGRRLVVAFQPHLYSRTRDFLEDFTRTLSAADVLFVTDIYAARETPIEGVSAGRIVDLVQRERPDIPAMFVPDKRQIPQALRSTLRGGDLCVFMGAGDIRAQGEALVDQGLADQLKAGEAAS